MDGNDDAEPDRDFTLRRRHSAPQDDPRDQSPPSPKSSSTTLPQTNRPRWNATDSATRAGSDVSSIGGKKRKSSDRGHRVRFSLDDVDSSRAKPLDDDRPNLLETIPSNSTVPLGRRPGTPSLSIDVGKASSSSVQNQGTVKSPTSARSSTVQRIGSPTSAGGRHRGLSLRRTLFHRNVSDQMDGPSPVIELQDGASTNAAAGSSKPLGSQDLARPSKTPQDAIVDIDSPFTHDRNARTDKKGGLSQGMAALPNYESWIRDRTAKFQAVRQIKDTFRKFKKRILRISEIPLSKNGRHIEVDASRKTPLTDERTGRPYLANTIRSSRYNAWNFLPRQLIAQFSKLANFYFLCISILQMIPGLSTTGQFTTIIPLLFFVSISIGREGYDDLRRNRLDKEENNKECSVLHAYKPIHPDQTSREDVGSPTSGPKHWAKTKWKDVQVGDIVKLERDQAAPADIVLLQSTGENGAAFVETMALDGETNLKSKYAPRTLSQSCESMDSIASCRAQVVVEDPNLDLYNFEGRVTTGDETIPLNNGEVIYRGSIIRNTREATGLVVYSGEECKIRMNANKNPRIKAPSLQALVNKIIIFIVVFVVLLSIYNSAAYEIWHNSFEDQAWYLSEATVSFGPIIVSFIIMFNTMIPLSLYVSLEIIKVAQTFLLNDLDMYDEQSNTPMEARTSTINEELGQISYIFSDKTGTLTDNVMKFRKMSVAGTAWLHDNDLQREAAKESYQRRLSQTRKNKGKKPLRNRSARSEIDERPRPSNVSSAVFKSPATITETPVQSAPSISNQWKSSARPAKAQPEMHSMEMLHYIQRKPFTVFARKARFFLLCLALCHTCLPETSDDGSIKYQAASPDELALVEAAQELGFIVIDRVSGVIRIKTFPNGPEKEAHVETYEILDVIEFSSKRKRMSVVVRFPDKRICVVSKGADSTMMQLLRLSAHAMKSAGEVERRASERKSMEAQQAIARKSESHDIRSPVSRKSSAFGRPSVGTLSRKFSFVASPARALTNQLDSWLNEREREVDLSQPEERSQHYSPRPSTQVPRRSTTSAELRKSMQDDEDFELVEESLVVDEEAVIERCLQHINDFATEGLRTLLYGYRFLNPDEYSHWKKIYHDAVTSLDDRQAKIESAGDMIEQDFELAGATAIEDKLQKGVPEAIDKLRRANIKMWMLTGDKRETAINIGYSCRLVKDYSSVFVLDHESGHIQQDIAKALVAVQRGSLAHSVVVIDGQTLGEIDPEPSLRSLFLDLAILADSVICCRASPSQKATLVKRIRHKVRKSITLAIGDGANDIAMIQEAHVGIGITGKEGLQAARTADYSIAKFCFLSKLLLVHGRYNYLRTCKYTLATFWKEMTFYLTQALYQRWAGYTGTSLHESWSLSQFNTLFTSLPVIFLGIFEKDLAPATLLAVPELYAIGQQRRGFNVKLYLWWMALAVTDTCIVFFLPLRLYAQPSLPPNQLGDVFSLGDMVFTCVVLLVSAKVLGLEMHNRTFVNALGAFLMLGGWFLWNMILSQTYNNNTIYDVKDGFLHRFGRDPAWWATLAVVLFVLFTIEVGLKVMKITVRPSDAEVFQGLEKDEMANQRFEEAAAMELENSLAAKDEGIFVGEKQDSDSDGGGKRGIRRFAIAKPRKWAKRGFLPGKAKGRRSALSREVDSIAEEDQHMSSGALGLGLSMEEHDQQRHDHSSEEQERREAEVRELLRKREGTADVDMPASPGKMDSIIRRRGESIGGGSV